MKRTLVAIALAAVVMPLSALADPPKTLRVVESVQIKAPADKVWAAVKDFDSLPKWHPGFASDELVSGANNTPGTVRKLTIKDGPALTEKLLAFNEAGHSYRYMIVDSPLPIQNYVSRISVTEGKDGTSKVVWSGTFKRKNPADNPPEAESDAGAKKLVKGVYQGGLSNLKKMLEG